MVIIVASFLEYVQGYFIFQLENGDLIDFEQINKKVLSEFDLKSNELKGKKFIIEYQEVFDDEDEDFVAFKLENLKLA